MAVRFDDKTNSVASGIDRNVARFLRLTLEGVHNAANPKTPYRHGDLRTRVIKRVAGRKGVIRWETSYAAIQEKRQGRRYTTPGTGAHFAEKAVKEAIRNAPKYLKRAGLT